MTKTYQGQILDDGYLSLSEEIRNQLELKQGDLVEVTISKPSLPASFNNSDNPLLKLVGICREGNRTDLALNHDRYLYHEDSP